MEEYKIRPALAACEACKRTFSAGESIHSTILAEGERFVRKDHCLGCRPAESEAAVFCFFQTHAPQPETSQRTILEEVREFFKKLEALGECGLHQRRLRYLSALWLSRKKQLKLVETKRLGDLRILVLQKAWDGEPLELPEEPIPEAELAPLLEELGTLFHLNAAASKVVLSP